jgi:hypothetical protein
MGENPKSTNFEMIFANARIEAKIPNPATPRYLVAIIIVKKFINKMVPFPKVKYRIFCLILFFNLID